MDSLELIAVLNKIQTTVDGGWRITLDLDASNAEQIMILSQLRDRAIKIIVEPLQEVD